MIKIENTDVYGWESAIRGMRNPMNSWAQSDTAWKDLPPNFEGSFIDIDFDRLLVKTIGENDLRVMQNLIKPGTPDHRKYLRYIEATCDVVAPLYWWKEFDTYKVGTVANSCSTMHKIHAKMFEIDDFSHDKCSEIAEKCLEKTISCLNFAREMFLKTHDKAHWWDMIQLLPTSYNQRRTVKMNYEVLRNIYHARKNHKLDEWYVFCKWIESLPYAKELILYEN